MIVKYPVEQWESMGAPFFSAKSWCKLATEIAKNDLANLENVSDTAETCAQTLPAECLTVSTATCLASQRQCRKRACTLGGAF